MQAEQADAKSSVMAGTSERSGAARNQHGALQHVQPAADQTGEGARASMRW